MPLQRRPNSLRHPDADYSDPGMYYVTLCTQGRERIFGEIGDGKFQGNDFSRIVWDVWRSIPERYPQISIDAAVVMPDHFHGIIVIHDQTVGVIHDRATVGVIHELPLRGMDQHEPPSRNLNEIELPLRQKRRIMTIPLIVGYLKMNTAKRINEIRETPGERVWQRGYFDRIVRINREYDATVEYILSNPLRWGIDKD